ncbi:Glutamate 5-kinase [Saliniradius amylolyticus]|uniref:Glutamate 5-kinase n=1 Tax=Saliniradius amylolyticus TaxID=2183582 RepID=A0A2S2E0V4_9ALTE|nr:glutamate 5-kinase [Saliniradius amylolyticus]AWL11256.1 Glutamate 5-kinase [Saliniradius amylolyticus]
MNASSNNYAPFQWQRAVIKVGSNLIAPQGNRCCIEHLMPLAQFISQSRRQGKSVVLVSSGAVAAGRSALGGEPPASLSRKQAMAAVGQNRMMANWARLFDFDIAQMLLTHNDIRQRDSYLNIKSTLRELLEFDILPIVNENDSVASDELKFGDNDNLAALVALVAEADTLMLCTDIDGLYTANPHHDPKASPIRRVETLTAEHMALAGDSHSCIGTGGMLTKLQAASKAAANGVQTLIINGGDANSYMQLSQGRVPGTLIQAGQSRDSAKKNWLRHSLKAKGQLAVDEGAAKALVSAGASLLPVGITEVQGHFDIGEAVEVSFQGKVIATGLSQYSAAELRQICGAQSLNIESRLGYVRAPVAVHRDDLILH